MNFATHQPTNQPHKLTTVKKLVSRHLALGIITVYDNPTNT